MRKALILWALLAVHAHAPAQWFDDPILDFSLVLPPPPDKHVLLRPAVAWEIKANPASYCQGVAEQDGHAVWKEGCVYWNKAKSSCTVVTGQKTSHSLLGHLFLLCLQAGEPS